MTTRYYHVFAGAKTLAMLKVEFDERDLHFIESGIDVVVERFSANNTDVQYREIRAYDYENLFAEVE